MRESILFLLFVAVACDRAGDAGYVVIDDFSRTATALTCETVEIGVEAAATELRLASDSTWTLLDAPQLQVMTFDDEFRLLDRMTLPAVGPGAAPSPTSVALLGDTAVAVAARGGLRLVVLSRDGRELATTPLDFIPHSVATSAAGAVLVTPMPFGTKPPTLLLRLADGKLDTLAVPKRSYEDMMINALGNATLVESLPDGSALVVHQFLQPRAFRVSAAGTVGALPFPTPDGTRQQIPYVPRAPITEEQMGQTLVPAMAMSVDRGRSHVYLLTRSGRNVDGRPERAILRLSEGLEFLEGFTLPVAAGSMVYLPRRRAALVVDDTDTFHLCPLPRAGSRL